ncbi:MAG: LacI family DNA-binding transcriptional regulator, partial [Protaetiibacter sp.]
MTVTQADVALRAGVARKTVSNVITGYEHVRPAVRQRVLDAIEELGYQPNRAAQNLRTGRSGAIGLAVPELDVSYFAELTRHVVEAAERHGLTVVIIQTLGNAERERGLLTAFSQRAIDGLIYSPIASSAEEISSRPGRFPIVLLGEQVTYPGLDHVGIDNVAAARVATEHLIAIGRRRIAFIGAGTSADSHMADQRLQGYREALGAAGIPADPALIETVTGYHRPDGARAMSRLLTPDASRRPDGVFCANDLLALGAMRAIADAGLRIPDDIAVVGFDNVE